MSKHSGSWEKAPAKEDYASAKDYLSLVFDDPTVAVLIRMFRGARTVTREAKDVLRASEQPLLDKSDPNVARDLNMIKKGEKLSPVLLVRGNAPNNVPVLIGDGIVFARAPFGTKIARSPVASYQ